MSERDWPSIRHFGRLAKLYLVFGASAGVIALLLVVAIAHPAWLVAFVSGAACLVLFERFGTRAGALEIELISGIGFIGLFHERNKPTKEREPKHSDH